MPIFDKSIYHPRLHLTSLNILFVVPYVPSVVRVRPYNLIRCLSQRGHSVTVLTLWSNEKELSEATELNQLCQQVVAVRQPPARSIWNCVRALPSHEPLQAAFSWSNELYTHLMRRVQTSDVVHVEHLRGARYAIRAKAKTPSPGVPVIWDSVDCISHLFEQAAQARIGRAGRLLNRIELSRTRAHEEWLVRQFDRVLVTSQADRAALADLRSANSQIGVRDVARPPSAKLLERIVVLSNGVDTNQFTPGRQSRSPNTLVFSGKMSYHANVAAAVRLIKEIMPRIWASRRDTHLEIVGKDPPQRLRRLASRFPRVTLTGAVPDMGKHLTRATVAVVPLVYGVGCQNKVLEAMSCATPVVATPQAVAALEAQAGSEVLVAQGSESFAQAVLHLLNDPRTCRELGQAGREYVCKYHRWDQSVAQLEQIYLEAVGSWKTRSSESHALRTLAAS